MRAIMVMFDSLNRNYLPNYGCDWVKAPNFERLAEKTVTFDSFFAGSMPCMPARRELHTGRINFLHRSWGALEPFDASMPEILKNNGVYSHLITDHFHYFEDGGATYHTRYNTWEFARGQQGDPWVGLVGDAGIPACENPRNMYFDNWRQDWVNRHVMDSEEKQSMPVCFTMGMEFLERNSKEDNWFLQIEAFDPHEPFYTMEKYKNLYPHEYNGKHYDWINYGRADEDKSLVAHLQYEYAALVSMCDEYLGKILDAMDQNNMWQDTMLIVNTDHGLMVGEKEWYGKNIQPFYNEISNIPFFIYDPRSKVQNERRNALCQTIDIAPTLLDFFDVGIPNTMQGKPLKETVVNDKKIRDAALFGIFGGHVNVADDDYIYMRANTTSDNDPLYEYTLMPVHMRSMFSTDELRNITIAEKGTFTFIDCDVMRIKADAVLSSDVYGNLLFDRKSDPKQENPLDDKCIELRMAKKMMALMTENDCPEEQWERLGLTKRSELREEDLIVKSKKEDEWSINTPIGKLLENAESAAVLKAYFKDALNDPRFDMAKGLSLVKLKKLAKGMITEEVLKNIEKDLLKIKAKK